MAARANGRGVSCSRVSLGEMEQRFEQDPQVTHNTVTIPIPPRTQSLEDNCQEQRTLDNCQARRQGPDTLTQ